MKAKAWMPMVAAMSAWLLLARSSVCADESTNSWAKRPVNHDGALVGSYAAGEPLDEMDGNHPTSTATGERTESDHQPRRLPPLITPARPVRRAPQDQKPLISRRAMTAPPVRQVPSSPGASVADIGLASYNESSVRLNGAAQDAPLLRLTYADSDPEDVTIGSRKELLSFEPWWQPLVVSPHEVDGNRMELTIDQLLLEALRHSHFVRAQSDLPLISETDIVEAAAEFDVHAFTRSRFTRTSEPIGNVLVTGPGRTRFRDELWDHSAGVRRRTTKGASVELLQRYGYQQNNSEFLIPNPQSTAQLALRFSQPLLRGCGRAYNTSIIVLAEIDKNIAWEQFRTDLQDYLVEVVTGYWDLYLQRAVMLQRQRHLQRATEILAELETRRDIDAAQSQIVRAASAVASRRSDLARARAAIRKAQVRLRATTNLPWLDDPSLEIVPREAPRHEYVDLQVQDALVTALQNRPEIDEAMQQLRSARLQISVSEHELLPILDLVTESYVMGLRPDSGVGQAWTDQFSVGEPSYSVGIEMEVPLRNRAAGARHRRKQLQLRSLSSRYRGTVETISSEAEVAVVDVKTAHTEMGGKYHAMKATKAELDYLTEHWRLLPGDDRSASFLLEDILNVQDRHVVHEFEFARAQVAYAQSLVHLKRATGTLLQAEHVTIQRVDGCGLPNVTVDKTPAVDGGGSMLLDSVEVTAPFETQSDPVQSDPVEMLPEPGIRDPAAAP